MQQVLYPRYHDNIASDRVRMALLMQAPDRKDPMSFATKTMGGSVWSDSDNAWTTRAAQEAPLPHTDDSSNNRTNLRFFTYNVFYGVQQDELRHPAIFQLINAEDPDVIALQEVTLTFLRRLLAQPWVQQHYVVSDSDGTLSQGMIASSSSYRYR